MTPPPAPREPPSHSPAECQKMMEEMHKPGGMDQMHKQGIDHAAMMKMCPMMMKPDAAASAPPSSNQQGEHQH